MTQNDKDFEALLEQIREARNFDFRNYKRATLRRRIERRMSDCHATSIVAYKKVLEDHPEEFGTLISSMLIKVTSFMRDAETWEALSKKVLPEILASKRPGDEIRIWCAGCSTGEEAYSIAILMGEQLGPSFGSFDVKIFGTDVDEAAIALGRRGIYSTQQIDGLPKALVQRWTTPSPAGFAIRKEIRRVVVFGVNNLVSDAPISRIDLLLCRNVFIYLDTPLQKRVLTRFHYALRRDGVLVLGKSELIPFAAKMFQPVDLTRRIYRKDPKMNVPLGPQERGLGILEHEQLARLALVGREESMAGLSQLHRDVLNSLRVPVIATIGDGSIVLWNNGAWRLWGRTEGEVLGKKLPSLGLPGLAGDLLVEKTQLVRDGKSERETADGLIHRPGESRPVQLTVEVTSLRSVGEDSMGVLYVVHDATAFRSLEIELRRVNEERQSAMEELQSINEELQSSNEELETTNEELQSANEELQTTNEELQSANEELETTNEELQSTNAELDATNRELAARTEELNLLGFYQRTIIRSLSAAVVVLDLQGRVTMWNLAAERLLGLPEGETIGQIFWTLRVPAFNRSLISRIRRSLGRDQVLRVEDIEYELPVSGRGHGNLAAIPLIESGNHFGAVILFEDFTRTSRGAIPDKETSEPARPGRAALARSKS